MNILLTSVGRRSYLVQYFKAALAGQGLVHVSNSSPISPAFTVADRTVISPLIYDSNYIPFLLEYCQKEQIQVVLSLFDIDLPVLAAHRLEFEAVGVQVIVSKPQVIQICNDKWQTYCFLKEHNFAAPITYLDLQQAKVALNNGELSFPVLLKPRWGMGSLSIFDAQNMDELEVLYHKCQREIEQSYLCYEAREDIAHAVIIQELIQGEEFGLDIINDLSASYQTTVVKKKIAMRSGETDCAQVVEMPALKVLGKQISDALGHIGNLDMDVLCRADIPYIIDLNARFGGGYPYSHLAGVNLPQAIISWALGEVVDQSILIPKTFGCYGKDIVMTEIKLSDQ